jgi:hypothetical protein
MDGDVHAWHNKQFTGYNWIQPPAFLTHWDLFQTHFESCWLDLHKGQKALNTLLKGVIIQKYSVKQYNKFNKLLTLTNTNSQNPAILCQYVTSLKPLIHTTTITPL